MSQPTITPPVGVTFDPAPVPQSTAQSTPPPGVTFDSQPVPGTQPPPAQPTSDEIQIDPNDSLATKAVKGVGSFFEGAGEGVFKTAAGASDLVDRVTGMQRGSTNAELHTFAGDNNASHGTGQLIGQGAEDIAEFLSGDALLTKTLSYGAKLRKVASLVETLEQSPKLVNVLKAAGISFGQSEVKTGGDTKEAAETAALTGVGAGILSGAATGVGAIRKAYSKVFDVQGIQKPLQDGIRGFLSDAASNAGVPEPTAASIRDAAQQVADGVKAKASGLYSKIDEVSGGQAQRFRDAAHNVSQKLGEIVGLDDEKEAELVKRQAEIETAHKAMLDKLEAKGYDRDVLQQADAVWKQQSALSDLSNVVRQSTSGLRPELAAMAKGATSPESVNTKTLFTKLNRLNDRGRLAQAIGPDNADALLQHVDAAYLQAQKIAARNKGLDHLIHTVGIGGAASGALYLAHRILGTNE